MKVILGECVAYDLTLSSIVQVLLPWGLIMGCWRQRFFNWRRKALALGRAFQVDLLVDFQCNLFYQVLFFFFFSLLLAEVYCYVEGCNLLILRLLVCCIFLNIFSTIAVLVVWNLGVLSLLLLPVCLKSCRIKDFLCEFTALSELNRVWTGHTVTGENSRCLPQKPLGVLSPDLSAFSPVLCPGQVWPCAGCSCACIFQFQRWLCCWKQGFSSASPSWHSTAL